MRRFLLALLLLLPFAAAHAETFEDIGVSFDCSVPPDGVAGVSVTGSVEVGGTIFLDVRETPCPAGRVYILIANDGTDPMIGRFTNAPEGGVLFSNGQLFLISYVGGTGNDLTATAISSQVDALDNLGMIALSVALACAALILLRR